MLVEPSVDEHHAAGSGLAGVGEGEPEGQELEVVDALGQHNPLADEDPAIAGQKPEGDSQHVHGAARMAGRERLQHQVWHGLLQLLEPGVVPELVHHG